MQNFKDREKFIKGYVAEQTQRVQNAVSAYLAYAKEEGARTCNDGFPDTRFKGTYPEKHLKARKFISRIREYHDFCCGNGNGKQR